ncbi:MAG TPA: DUF2892 domain-containing protein [Pseudogracilibacillus sp.]|nr:DUF2892 domain-containing protein [Pseudogracilibacillus sp.]
MKANVGTVDRVVRLIVGVILLALFFLIEGNLRYIGLIGIIPIITALVSFCPLYSLLRINTRRSS